VRAVIAAHIPSAMIGLFAGLGILALTADAEALKALAAQSSLVLGGPEKWDGTDVITAEAGDAKVSLRWRAVGAEREWTAAGTTRTAAPAIKR
jgi:hypothetical protein